MKRIIWVHSDALSSHHPVFSEASEGAKAIYIWDADDVKARGWSLKRCVFVLECLADMDVDIIEGRLDDVLRDQRADEILTPSSPDPTFKDVMKTFGDVIHIVPDHPFAKIPDKTDMGRFFRYWNKAKRSILSPSEA